MHNDLIQAWRADWITCRTGAGPVLGSTANIEYSVRLGFKNYGNAYQWPLSVSHIFFRSVPFHLRQKTEILP